MSKAKTDKQEKVTAGVCVCGQEPVTVKHKSRYLVACPDSLRCSMRGEWKGTEQEAIASWNTARKAHGTTVLESKDEPLQGNLWRLFILPGYMEARQLPRHEKMERYDKGEIYRKGMIYP